MTHTDKRTFPTVSIGLALATVIVSLGVGQMVNGTPFDTVTIRDLAVWGGVTFLDIKDLELWRIATAQLVHVKWQHMFYNALCLGLVGAVIERRISGFRTFCVWLVAGGAATLISPIGIAPPFNVGTGASQAVLAFAAFSLVLYAKGFVTRRTALLVGALVILPAFAIDIVFAGYPKPGHIAAIVFGVIAGMFALRQLSPK